MLKFICLSRLGVFAGIVAEWQPHCSMNPREEGGFDEHNGQSMGAVSDSGRITERIAGGVGREPRPAGWSGVDGWRPRVAEGGRGTFSRFLNPRTEYFLRSEQNRSWIR